MGRIVGGKSRTIWRGARYMVIAYWAQHAAPVPRAGFFRLGRPARAVGVGFRVAVGGYTAGVTVTLRPRHWARYAK